MNLMRLFIFLALLVMSVQMFAQQELNTIKNLSSELVNIRQEIETLHSEINFEKDNYRDQLRAYSNQKSDLNLKISRAELNAAELERELKKLAELNQQTSNIEVTNAVNQSINTLIPSIENSIPFKREQRLEALNDIANRLNAGVITPNRAANQLWAFIEDELAMGRSSGLYNDTVEINGQPSLVKTLRLGKVAMFYQSQSGDYGLISQQNNTWSNKMISSATDIAQLDKLFDAYAKNIRNGLYTVPNFLPER